MELVYFISQDSKHFFGALVVAYVIFIGLESLIKAWRRGE